MTNHIQIYDNVLSKESCHYIIEYYDSSSDKHGGLSGGQIKKNIKDSMDLGCDFLSPRNHMEDTINKKVRDAIQIGKNKYKKKFPFLDEVYYWKIDKGYNIQKYTENQGYHSRHAEVCGPLNSNRMLVWMIYLNNAKSGTRFYYPTRNIRARRGRLVLWPAYWMHPHSGITPNKGEKYILTGWFSYN